MQLTETIVEKMHRAALEASRKSYCRYSKFRVGAAVVTGTGKIFSGCNVENASFGLTICAERNAVYQAVANGYRRILAVAIVTPTAFATPPCGACRQVIHEFGADAEIISFGKGGKTLRLSLKELLPVAFGPKNF